MQTINNVKVKETRWVTTADGIRMTYDEYIEMVRSERN